jgi:hypothetical protein
VALSRIPIPVDLLPANDGQRGGALAGTVIRCGGSTPSAAWVILLAALAYFYDGSQVRSGQRPLRSLTAENVDEIKNEFNAANNEIRILLLLSPTCIVCLQGPLQPRILYGSLRVNKCARSLSENLSYRWIGRRHLLQL